jgi:hypothetical protein
MQIIAKRLRFRTHLLFVVYPSSGALLHYDVDRLQQLLMTDAAAMSYRRRWS